MKGTYLNISVASILIAIWSFTGCSEKIMEPQEYYGIVVDYTGFDGCGFVIELDNGSRLEPVQMADTGFTFRDGQRVALTFTAVNLASICMVGQTVRIESIREVGCIPIQDLPISFRLEDLPNDPFTINSTTIVDDCLEIHLSYSGGCEIHQFTAFQLPVWCGTPPIPPPMLVLCHEDRDDPCDAYINETISIDLTSLRKAGAHATQFILTLNYDGASYQKTLTYKY